MRRQPGWYLLGRTVTVCCTIATRGKVLFLNVGDDVVICQVWAGRLDVKRVSDGARVDAIRPSDVDIDIDREARAAKRKPTKALPPDTSATTFVPPPLRAARRKAVPSEKTT